jgi:hypothetical protein
MQTLDQYYNNAKSKLIKKGANRMKFYLLQVLELENTAQH